MKIIKDCLNLIPIILCYLSCQYSMAHAQFIQAPNTTCVSGTNCTPMPTGVNCPSRYCTSTPPVTVGSPYPIDHDRSVNREMNQNRMERQESNNLNFINPSLVPFMNSSPEQKN